MPSWVLSLLLAALTFLAGSVRLGAESLLVFAASSLKSVLDDLEPGYEQETGIDLVLSYAGSSTLARQIELGAPADVFVSANDAWMDHLNTAGLIDPASRRSVAGNTLVIVAHDPEPQALSPSDLPAALAGRPLAIALPDAVPAGIYGRAALTHHGVWEAVAPLATQSDNVRAALALVALGEAPFGVVFGSDATSEPRVHIVHRFDPETHPAIVFPAATVRGSPASRDFIDYLQGDLARAAFLRHGFTLVEG